MPDEPADQPAQPWAQLHTEHATHAAVTALKDYLARQTLTDEERLQVFTLAAHALNEAAMDGWILHRAAKIQARITKAEQTPQQEPQ